MVKCKVERVHGIALEVTFPDHPGKSLFMQSEDDQVSFASSCGLCGSEDDGYPGWEECEPTDITECPDDYLEVAQNH